MKKIIAFILISATLAGCSSQSKKTEDAGGKTTNSVTTSVATTTSKNTDIDPQKSLNDFSEVFMKWLNNPNNIAVVVPKFKQNMVLVGLTNFDCANETDDKMLELAKKIKEIKANVVKAHIVTDQNFEEPQMFILDKNNVAFAGDDGSGEIRLLSEKVKL